MERSALPPTAPWLAAALVALGALSGTTCISWFVHRGCTGSDLHWPVWDPIVGAATRASGLPIWSWFREDGPLVWLIALGPVVTSTLGLLAIAVILAWGHHSPAAPPSLRLLAAACLLGALGCVGLGLWGTVVFVGTHA
jgi:hypothetical protein